MLVGCPQLSSKAFASAARARFVVQDRVGDFGVSRWLPHWANVGMRSYRVLAYFPGPAKAGAFLKTRM